MRPGNAILVVVALLASSCAHPDAMDAAKRFDDARDQQRFKEALADARIPFEVRSVDGREWVWYPTRFEAEVADVEAQLYGPPPPNGRSVTHDLMRRLEPELRKRAIPYWKATYRGREYLAWAASEDDKIDAVLGTFSDNPGFVAGFQQDRDRPKDPR